MFQKHEEEQCPEKVTGCPYGCGNKNLKKKEVSALCVHAHLLLSLNVQAYRHKTGFLNLFFYGDILLVFMCLDTTRTSLFLHRIQVTQNRVGVINSNEDKAKQ